MISSRTYWLLMLGLLWTCASRAAEPKISFSRQIKPILAAKCFACHGPDEKERKAELRLDVRNEAVPGVIKPGDGEHSEVFVRIVSEDVDAKMPPTGSKKSAVTPDEAQLIRRWIEEGAEYDAHWAYVRPQRPELPAVKAKDWPLNEIDHFIL